NIIGVRYCFSFWSYLLMLYYPGLGQGHGKKRHLHAHSPVNFKALECYEFFRLAGKKDVNPVSTRDIIPPAYPVNRVPIGKFNGASRAF
ncbi:MAG: hypothetical protein V3R28_01645, partial [Desulfatiglandales bacterium]